MMKMPLLAALGLSGEVFLHIVVKMTGRAHEVRTAFRYTFVRLLSLQMFAHDGLRPPCSDTCVQDAYKDI